MVRADHRDAEEVLASLLDTLLDGRGNFLGLAVADADQAVAVTDDDQRGEAEATTTLDDLGDTVDRDDALEVVSSRLRCRRGRRRDDRRLDGRRRRGSARLLFCPAGPLPPSRL